MSKEKVKVYIYTQIAYGRRRTEKVHGTRNDYRQVYKEDYLLVDGLHEALVSEEVWEQI